jgi:hypothetical protein
VKAGSSVPARGIPRKGEGSGGPAAALDESERRELNTFLRRLMLAFDRSSQIVEAVTS